MKTKNLSLAIAGVGSWAGKRGNRRRRGIYFRRYRRERLLLKRLDDLSIHPLPLTRKAYNRIRVIYYRILPFLATRLIYLPDREMVLNLTIHLGSIIDRFCKLRGLKKPRIWHHGAWTEAFADPRLSSGHQALVSQ